MLVQAIGRPMSRPIRPTSPISRGLAILPCSSVLPLMTIVEMILGPVPVLVTNSLTLPVALIGPSPI